MTERSEPKRSEPKRLAAYPDGMPEEMRRAAERDLGPSEADDPAELARRLEELIQRRDE